MEVDAAPLRGGEKEGETAKHEEEMELKPNPITGSVSPYEWHARTHTHTPQPVHLLLHTLCSVFVNGVIEHCRSTITSPLSNTISTV